MGGQNQMKITEHLLIIKDQVKDIIINYVKGVPGNSKGVDSSRP